jgi:ABC-type thiamine transport system ATPase subunit
LLLCERRLREGFVGRAATLYGIGIAVSYAVVALIAPMSALELTRRALVTAVVVVGALVGLAGLRDASAERSLDAVTALLREHGARARCRCACSPRRTRRGARPQAAQDRGRTVRSGRAIRAPSSRFRSRDVSELVLSQLSAGALLHADWRFGPGATLLIGDDAQALAMLVAVASGTATPTRGRVLLDGLSLEWAPEARRRLASLLADETLAPARSVEVAVGRVLEARGDAPEPQRLLRAFGLERWGARRVSELDWDERRSLGLGLALGHERATVLLLYEAFGTSSIDPSRVREGILSVVERGGVVVLATTNPPTLAGLDAPMIWLERGVLRGSPLAPAAPPPPAAVAARPENQVVSLPTAFADPTRPNGEGNRS